MHFSGIFAFCILGLAYGAPGKLPESWVKCAKHDPNTNECLKNAVQSAFANLANGAPSLGVFPIDPLKITALDIDQGTGPVAIDLKFRDLEIKGLSAVKVTKARSDVDKYTFELHGEFPKPLFLDGKYKVNGSVLVLPLIGDGDAHLSLENVKAHLTITGKEVKKDGKSYMELEKFDFDYNTSKLTMNFENLFSQNKALADNLNVFLNENWQEIHKELKPAIIEAFGTAFKAVTHRILSKVPYDDLFLK